MSADGQSGGVMCVSPALQPGKPKRVRFGSVTIIPIPRRHQASLSSSCDTLDSPRSPSDTARATSKGSEAAAGGDCHDGGAAASQQILPPLLIPPPPPLPPVVRLPLCSTDEAQTDTPVLLGEPQPPSPKIQTNKLAVQLHAEDHTVIEDAHRSTSTAADAVDEAATQPVCTLSGNEDELLVALRRSNTSADTATGSSPSVTSLAADTLPPSQEQTSNADVHEGGVGAVVCDTAAWLGSTSTSTITDISTTASTPRCAFCCNVPQRTLMSNVPLLRDDDDNDDGEQDVESTQSTCYYHALCAAWCPEVYYDTTRQRFCNVRAALARCAEIKCASCRQPGASIGCASPDCQLSYHLPCAQQARHATIDAIGYVFYCPTHKPTKPRKTSAARQRQTRKRART